MFTSNGESAEGRVSSERVLRLITGYWATGIVGSAAAHSVFTHLDGKPATADQLAERAGIAPRGAQALLDGLVSLELAEVAGGYYRNTAEASAYLVEGRPGCLTGFAKVKMGHMAALGGLPEVVAHGGPLSDAVVEIADNPHWNQLVQALAAQSVPVATLAAGLLDVGGAGPVSILDIGGGSGVYSAAWLALNPAATATQLDWAPVNRIATRLLTERGLADRFSTIDGDLRTTDYGTGAYDLVVYSNIAHQESPDSNEAVLTKIRAALRPGGALVISDYVVDGARTAPPYALTFAGEMLLKSKQGSTWTRTDYQSWLTRSGYTDITYHPTPSPTTLIIAK